jgi:hypothetical protein
MSPLLFATSMMRPIASALAATVSSNLAGSPLTRMVVITDMDPPFLVWLRDPTPTLSRLGIVGVDGRPGSARVDFNGNMCS